MLEKIVKNKIDMLVGCLVKAINREERDYIYGQIIILEEVLSDYKKEMEDYK